MEKAEQALLRAYEENRDFLADLQWEWEEDRWLEFIICMFSEGHGIPSDAARKAVDVLAELGLASVRELRGADEGRVRLASQILERVGVAETDAGNAVASLIKLAQTVQDKWDGHIQRFLRSFGERMALELAAALADGAVEKAKASKVATLWLQNVANLPILLPDEPHIRAFSSEFGISRTELVEIADELDLNVASVDDILLARKLEGSRTKHRGKGGKSIFRKPAKARR